MTTALAWAAGGTGFTFLMTTLGAASVFLFRKRDGKLFQQVFLGYDGVPCAGSFKLTLRESIACVIDYCRTLWIDTRTRLCAMPSVSPIPCDAPMDTNE